MGAAPTPPHHRFFATTSRTGFSPILRILSRRATRLSAAATARDMRLSLIAREIEHWLIFDRAS
jgi:hypothetical protein